MMTVDEFKSLCASLEIDESLQIDSSMRLGPTVVSTGPTRAMTGNPFVATRPVHDLELHETIGEGGMGLVRSATQHALRRQVAVKTLKPDVETGEATNTLLHEALVTGRLEHPNVVPIYTLGETEHGAPIIVMKRITGVSWLQCIQNPQAAPDFRPDDPLGWHLDIFEEVCLATHFAHSREIIHRDIKPENVMVGAFGEVYLLDWGVAVTVEEDKSGPLLHVTEATGICGTPMYMAPEMAAGESHRIGPRSDVYLLGATLLGERPRAVQWASIGLAGLGVAYLTFAYGQPPWISLGLATTFAAYGVLKKKAAFGALEGLGLETALMFLPALAYLVFVEVDRGGVFGHASASDHMLLVFSGVATAMPLLLFAAAVRRLPLTLVGVIQYLSPTIQFLLGVFVYHEVFTVDRLVGFVLIWLGLLIFASEGLWRRRATRSAALFPRQG